MTQLVIVYSHFVGFWLGTPTCLCIKLPFAGRNSHRTSSCMAAAGPAKEYASHAGIVEACEGSEEPIALRASPIPLFPVFLDDDPWPLFQEQWEHGWLFL